MFREYMRTSATTDNPHHRRTYLYLLQQMIYLLLIYFNKLSLKSVHSIHIYIYIISHIHNNITWMIPRENMMEHQIRERN